MRQPMKSVRPADQPSRATFRLSFAALSAVAAVAITWLLGHLGFRLGYAPAVLVPELLAEPGEGLATGVMILMQAPLTIFRAGLIEWPWLMAWFVVIAIPASSLAAVKSYPAGGPRPSSVATTFHIIGAVGTCLAAVLVFAWVLSPWRGAWLGPMPSVLGEVGAWHETVSAAAGLDVLALVAAVVWLVLAARLRTAVWLRVLTITAMSFALASAAAGLAMSGAIAAHAEAPKSLVFLEEDASVRPQLLLGYTRQHAAMMFANDQSPEIKLIDDFGTMTVVQRLSLVDWAAQMAPKPE